MTEEFLAALVDELQGDLQVPGDQERERLLELARDVAHGSERKNAPLATFIAGMYAATREQVTADSLTEVIEAAGRVLGSSRDRPAG